MSSQNLTQQDSSQIVSDEMIAIAKKQRVQDFFFHRVTQAFSLLVLVALMGIIISLFINAWPTFERFGFHFLWHVEWDIINEDFGAAIAIVGTVASASIALLIAVPLAFGVAVFLTETCPVWLRRPLGTAIELLAAVPSIIYGMFGLFVFAPLFADHLQVPLQNVLGGMPVVGFLFGGATNGMGILATRFAAKEAFSKAIGLGMRMPMSWRAMQTLNDPSGKPVVKCSGKLQTFMEEKKFFAQVSISDEVDMAIAFVVVTYGTPVVSGVLDIKDMGN